MVIPERMFFGAALLTAGYGGIARVARNSAKALIEAGVDLSMLALSDSSPTSIGDRPVRIANNSRLNFIAQCHAAAATHEMFMYDFLGSARAHPRIPGLRKPYIIWIHGVEIWGSLTAERQGVLRRAAIILSNSAYTLARFQEHHGPLTQARVCRLGTEENEPPSRPATFAGPPTALIVARMEENDLYKGHVELIELWPRVVAAVPDARLVIVGDGGAKAKIVALAARSSVASNINVMGFLSEAALSKMWSEAHVFAMPSRGEGFGLVYIEAMRHGVPVIASVHDAGQEVNVDGVTGYNVDLDRARALEERLIYLLSNTDRAIEMGRAGLTRWQTEYRFSAFKHRFLKALI